MELKKLDKSVLKLWYIRAAIVSLVLICAFIVAAAFLLANDVSPLALIAAGVSDLLILCFVLVMPALRYKMYAWGYDDKRIVVKQGVIFRRKVVIPVCQIQDLHRIQGPIMMMLKLSGVAISTAGSNFNISTLTTAEADLMIDELERNLETRIEELRNEKI